MGKKVLLTDEQCEKLNHCFCKAVADGLSWKEIDETLMEEQRELFHALADSEIPNEEFLPFFADSRKQRTKKIDYSAKIGWESGIYVLCLRGLPRIESVKYDFMVWWQDANTEGFLLVRKFVIDHGCDFRKEMKRALCEAIAARDEMWVLFLLQDFPLIVKMTAAQKKMIGSIILTDGSVFPMIMRNFTGIIKICDAEEKESYLRGVLEEIRKDAVKSAGKRFLAAIEANDEVSLVQSTEIWKQLGDYFPEKIRTEITGAWEDHLKRRIGIYDVIAMHLPLFMKLCGTEDRTEEFEKRLIARKEEKAERMRELLLRAIDRKDDELAGFLIDYVWSDCVTDRIRSAEIDVLKTCYRKDGESVTEAIGKIGRFCGNHEKKPNDKEEI